MTNLRKNVEDAVERAMGEFRERLMEIEIMSLHPEQERDMMRKVCELSYLRDELFPYRDFIEQKWPELEKIFYTLGEIRGYCDTVAQGKEKISANTRLILKELKGLRG